MSNSTSYFVAGAVLVAGIVGYIVLTGAPSAPEKPAVTPVVSEKPKTELKNEIAQARPESKVKKETLIKADTEKAEPRNPFEPREKISEWKDDNGNTITKLREMNNEQFGQWMRQEMGNNREAFGRAMFARRDLNGDGTITQEEEQSAMTAMGERMQAQREARQAEREADREKISAMTDEERNTFFQERGEQMFSNLRNSISEVYDSVGYEVGSELSDAQRDQVVNEMMTRMENGEVGFGGPGGGFGGGFGGGPGGPGGR